MPKRVPKVASSIVVSPCWSMWKLDQAPKRPPRATKRRPRDPQEALKTIFGSKTRFSRYPKCMKTKFHRISPQSEGFLSRPQRSQLTLLGRSLPQRPVFLAVGSFRRLVFYCREHVFVFSTTRRARHHVVLVGRSLSLACVDLLTSSWMLSGQSCAILGRRAFVQQRLPGAQRLRFVLCRTV